MTMTDDERREFNRTSAIGTFANTRRNSRGYGVVAATSKTGFGAARLRGVVHAIVEMAAVRHKSRIRFGARWLCGGGSSDAASVPEPPDYGDMCERCLELIQCGAVPGTGGSVYRCFDDAGRLLYVGSTITSVRTRLAVHEKDAPWWPAVADVRVEQFTHELAARAAEVRAIRTENPAHNVKERRRSA